MGRYLIFRVHTPFKNDRTFLASLYGLTKRDPHIEYTSDFIEKCGEECHVQKPCRTCEPQRAIGTTRLQGDYMQA